MKLTTRVSAFFLTALALILIGNSVLLFATARFYLYRHFDEQLESSLHTLVAAVEAEEDDVKWDLLDHTVTLGTESGIEDIRWLVRNDRGMIIDRSMNLQSTSLETMVISRARKGTGDLSTESGWRFLEQRLTAPDPKPLQERDPLEHAALTIVVARSLSDLNATLYWLAAVLIVLPTVCWMASAAAGQWFCRQALAPVRQMASSARSIRAEDPRGRLSVPASRDELEELGSAFNELLDKLFAAYERQRRFAGDAAHQLRTPLTVLQGQVEVSLRRKRTADDYEQTLHVLDDEVRALSKTAESLLFLAQPPGEEAVPDFQILHLAKWLDHYMLKWKSNSRSDDIALQVESDIYCCTSPGLLAQLLEILISNALKYSPSGSPVEVRARSKGQSLLFEVEDHGIGIAANDLDSIFEPFFRAQQARQSAASGTGLGLAIATRIAAVLGGSLRCTSQHGVGSRFSCELSNAIRPPLVS